MQVRERLVTYEINETNFFNKILMFYTDDHFVSLYSQNLTEDEKKSFLTTFEKVAQTGTPYADLIQNIV